MYQAPRGTKDILPEDAPAWEYVEGLARRAALAACFGEIRTPTFEDTAVFRRGVGDATDIVEKEMYTFEDRGGNSLTLRPEGTAAVVRAYLEHGMKIRPQPVRLFSLITAFRYDRPQRGRYREFHQLNAEAIGEEDPMVDAELTALQWRFYASLGLRDLSLRINSVGDPACRPGYVAALKDYFRQHEAALCADCRRRLDTAPLRLLDDKTPQCQPVLDAAPRSADHLCEPCAAHFSAWRGYLDAAGIPYTITPRLVRGLDYYTRSVWEVWPPREGAQSTLGGGGRYDGLAEQLGGPHTPGVGFATGIERLILEAQQQGVAIPPARPPDVVLAYQGAAGKQRAFALAERLRARGLVADLPHGDRRLGKQVASADKTGARYVAILGEQEVERGEVALKNLRSGEQRSVPEADLEGALAEARHST